MDVKGKEANLTYFKIQRKIVQDADQNEVFNIRNLIVPHNCSLKKCVTMQVLIQA